MKTLKQILAAVLGVVIAAGAVYAATGTNLGRTYTQPLMSDTLTASTAAQNATEYADRVGGRGTLVASYAVSLGTTGAVTLTGCTVPKGAILLEDAVIEVSTAVLPIAPGATVVIAGGGVTVLASNTNTLGTTGIKAAVATAAMATSAAAPTVTFAGGADITSGAFTVYMPYVQGTAWE